MIVLACDHSGYEVMQRLMKYFDKCKVEYTYLGPSELVPDDDYPDIIKPAVKEVLKDTNNTGIFMCGSGAGVCMVANRFKGIRAITAWDTVSAFYGRKDEDANVLCLGARLLSYRNIIKIIKMFYKTEFEGGRHLRRISKF